MLNKENIRELCYAVYIDAIEPIEGSDNCEAAIVGGWKVMVRKGTFNVGDPAIYFEIDSKTPETEQFAFLAKKHYKVKTQKYTFGGKNPGFYSQGLLMSAEDFGWTVSGSLTDGDYQVTFTDEGIVDDEGMIHIPNTESAFLTQKLGVTYADADDNKRKRSSSGDKYKKMAGRHPKLFSNSIIKWIYKKTWGKKLLFVFFGRPKDKNGWPEWVKKTDEERIQNCPWMLEDKSEWIATEKLDGTSTTMSLIKKGRKYDYYVCSRNVVFDTPDKGCYYDTNVYVEMSEKYKVEEVLRDILDKNNLEWVTLQGETFGAGVQKRDYSMTEHDFRAFNLIYSDRGRLNSAEAAKIVEPYGIKWVPIIDEHFIMPDTVDELLKIAEGESVIDGGMREGLVFRSQDGQKSFKAVSNEFLIKYH